MFFKTIKPQFLLRNKCDVNLTNLDHLGLLDCVKKVPLCADCAKTLSLTKTLCQTLDIFTGGKKFVCDSFVLFKTIYMKTLNNPRAP